MNPLHRSTRRAVAAPLTALLLTLSVAVPLVERADLGHTPVVESEHQPGSCPTPHDHTVCTQVGANHAAPGSHAAERPVEVVRRAAATTDAEEARDARSSLTRSARAPPSI